MNFPISGVQIDPLYLMGVGFVVGMLGGFFGVGGSFPAGPALFAVGVPMNFVVGTDLAHIVGKLGLNLRREKQTLEEQGVSARVVLRRGPVLEQILQEVQQGDYQLVVTGSAPSHSWRTYMLGDISRELLNRLNRAVLVVRSQEKPSRPSSGLLGWFER